MTTESEIKTSVDEDVKTLDEQIKALQEERSELATKQTAERVEQQRNKFNEIVESPSAILEATGIDMDALKAIGVTGFIVSVKPDLEGGPEVLSVEPVTAVAKKRTVSSGGGKSDKPAGYLKDNFEANATAEEQAAMAKVLTDGGDGNKVYALRLKAYKRVHSNE